MTDHIYYNIYSGWNGIQIEDIDADGFNEFLIDQNEGFKLVNHYGNVVCDCKYGKIADLTLIDLDKDNVCEFIIKNNQNLYLMDRFGSLLWQRELPHGNTHKISFRNVYGDQNLEIFIGNEILDIKGINILKYESDLHQNLTDKEPVYHDVDFDGKDEIIFLNQMSIIIFSDLIFQETINIPIIGSPHEKIKDVLLPSKEGDFFIILTNFKIVFLKDNFTIEKKLPSIITNEMWFSITELNSMFYETTVILHVAPLGYSNVKPFSSFIFGQKEDNITLLSNWTVDGTSSSVGFLSLIHDIDKDSNHEIIFLDRLNSNIFILDQNGETQLFHEYPNIAYEPRFYHITGSNDSLSIMIMSVERLESEDNQRYDNHTEILTYFFNTGEVNKDVFFGSLNQFDNETQFKNDDIIFIENFDYFTSDYNDETFVWKVSFYHKNNTRIFSYSRTQQCSLQFEKLYFNKESESYEVIFSDGQNFHSLNINELGGEYFEYELLE
jgi:hypothetical protein